MYLPSCGVLNAWSVEKNLPDTPGIQHTATTQVHYFIYCHLTVDMCLWKWVSPQKFENGSHPKNLHILYCHIKWACFLTILCWDPIHKKGNQKWICTWNDQCGWMQVVKACWSLDVFVGWTVCSGSNLYCWCSFSLQQIGSEFLSFPFLTHCTPN